MVTTEKKKFKKSNLVEVDKPLLATFRLPMKGNKRKK